MTSTPRHARSSSTASVTCFARRFAGRWRWCHTSCRLIPELSSDFRLSQPPMEPMDLVPELDVRCSHRLHTSHHEADGSHTASAELTSPYSRGEVEGDLAALLLGGRPLALLVGTLGGEPLGGRHDRGGQAARSEGALGTLPERPQGLYAAPGGGASMGSSRCAAQRRRTSAEGSGGSGGAGTSP